MFVNFNMGNKSKTRRLSAIMFTDMVGYSALMNRDESAAIKLLDNQRNIIHTIIKKFNGNILKGTGDGYLIEFNSAVDAVQCGLDMQRKVKDYNQGKKENEEILLRIGLHLGDILLKDDDIFGDGVNIASRIEPLAEPGGICISQTVYDQIKNKVEIETVDLGEKELKNIKEKINIYKVLVEAQEKTVNYSTQNDDDQQSDTNKTDKKDTTEKETVIKDDNVEIKIPDIKIKKDDKEIEIGVGGIRVKEKSGKDVKIDFSGIKVKREDGSNVNIGIDGVKVSNKEGKNISPKEKEYYPIFGKTLLDVLTGVGIIIIILGLTGWYSFWSCLIAFIIITVIRKFIKRALKK